MLDDPSFSTSNGVLVQQYQLNGGTNQQWEILTLANGNEEFLNAASHEGLEDPGSSVGPGTAIDQYPLYGALDQQWTVFVPNANPETDPNWAGYVAQTNLSSPQPDSVTFATGTWVVPTTTVPATFTSGFSTPLYDASVWVGIDGNNTNTVEQVGTEQRVVDGNAYYYAWWEMWSKGAGQPEQIITSMNVAPGDSITGSVQFFSSGPHAGQFELTITDNSRSNDSFTTYQASSATQNPLATRSTAEWIVESPTINGKVGPPADFGEVTFTDSYAVINGVWGAINSSFWQSGALNMTSNGKPSGIQYDTTSTLNASGTGFTEIYSGPISTLSWPSGSAILTSSGITNDRTGGPMIGGAAGTGASGLAHVAPIDPTALDALFAESDSAHDDAPRAKGPAADGQSSDGDVYLGILPASSRTAFGDGGTGIDILGRRRIFGTA